MRMPVAAIASHLRGRLPQNISVVGLDVDPDIAHPVMKPVYWLTNTTAGVPVALTLEREDGPMSRLAPACGEEPEYSMGAQILFTVTVHGAVLVSNKK
jgi:hypothetical protein